MKLREKIIIMIAFLMGVYGVTDFFVLSGQTSKGIGSSEKAAQDLEHFATIALANLSIAKAGNFEQMRNVAKSAEVDWKRDPFKVNVATGENEGSEEEMGEDSLEFVLIYMGFIRAGEHALAVINGMEYTVGEKIIDLGYKVSRITTSQVVLLTEANKEIVLYLEES